MTLLPVIWEKVKPDNIVYTDFYRNYDVLDVSKFNHFRINHSTNFIENKTIINGIENFWNQAKKDIYYKLALNRLREKGYIIQSITCDGRRGLMKDLFNAPV